MSVRGLQDSLTKGARDAAKVGELNYLKFGKQQGIPVKVKNWNQQSFNSNSFNDLASK